MQDRGPRGGGGLPTPTLYFYCFTATVCGFNFKIPVLSVVRVNLDGKDYKAKLNPDAHQELKYPHGQS